MNFILFPYFIFVTIILNKIEKKKGFDFLETNKTFYNTSSMLPFFNFVADPSKYNQQSSRVID